MRQSRECGQKLAVVSVLILGMSLEATVGVQVPKSQKEPARRHRRLSRFCSLQLGGHPASRSQRRCPNTRRIPSFGNMATRQAMGWDGRLDDVGGCRQRVVVDGSDGPSEEKVWVDGWMNAAGHGERESRLTTYSGMDWMVFSGAREAAGLSHTRWFLVGSRRCLWY